MKTLDLKSFSLLILCFVVTLSVNAQQQTSNQKKASLGDWLMDTPWRVGFGGSVIKDNNGNFDSSIKFFNYTYYPASFSAEKDLAIDRLSMQLVFTSTSFKPHSFGSADINFKYNFSDLFGNYESYDMYALLGCGVNYRDNNHLSNTTIYDDEYQPSLNTAFGVNLWLTKVMAINFEGQAKFATDPYLQANLGLVFEINPIIEKILLRPKNQEAKDALQHLRGIINK